MLRIGKTTAALLADPQHGLAAAVMFRGSPGEEGHQKRMRDVLSGLYEGLELV